MTKETTMAQTKTPKTKFAAGDRAAAVSAITREAFEPRFDAFKEKVVALVKASVAEQHPRWLELVADPTARRYVSEYTRTGYCSYQVPLIQPTFSGPVTQYTEKYSRLTPEIQRRCIYMGATAPCPSHDEYRLDAKHADMVQLYAELWDDFNSAWSTLMDVFNRYQTHEALLADFPEYKDYLPKPKVAASVPMLAPQPIRAQLSKLGVPSAGA